MARYQYTLKDGTIVSIDSHASLWSTIYAPITWFAGRKSSALYHANRTAVSPLGITRVDQDAINDSLDNLAEFASNVSNVFYRIAVNPPRDASGQLYMTKRTVAAWRRDAGVLEVNWTSFLQALNNYEIQLRTYANSGYVSAALRATIAAEAAQNQSNRAILLASTPISYVRDGTVFLNALVTTGSVKNK